MRYLSLLPAAFLIAGCGSAPTAVDPTGAIPALSSISNADPSEITFRVSSRFIDSVRVEYFVGETDFSGWVSPDWEITIPYEKGPKGMQASGPSIFLGHITSELWFDDQLVDTRTAKMGHVRGVVAGVVADIGEHYRVAIEQTNITERARVIRPPARGGTPWMYFRRRFLKTTSSAVWMQDAQYCRSFWATIDVRRGDRIRVKPSGEGEVGYTVLLDDGLDGAGDRPTLRRVTLLQNRLEWSTKTYFYFPASSFDSTGPNPNRSERSRTTSR